MDVPKGVKSMPKNKHKDLWIAAMDREFLALIDHNTWHLVARSKEMKVLYSHWVYAVKSDSDGYVSEFKANCVVDGQNEECTSYAPVFNTSNLRLLLAYAVKMNYEIRILDNRVSKKFV